MDRLFVWKEFMYSKEMNYLVEHMKLWHSPNLLWHPSCFIMEPTMFILAMELMASRKTSRVGIAWKTSRVVLLVLGPGLDPTIAEP